MPRAFFYSWDSSKPKTKAGERKSPMLDSLKDAFEMLWEEQQENGWNNVEINGNIWIIMM